MEEKVTAVYLLVWKEEVAAGEEGGFERLLAAQKEKCLKFIREKGIDESKVEQAASHYGDIRAHLEKGGKPMGSMDLLIAAHARSLSLTLVTNNVKEFDRVPGLRTENWA
jgi:predicted nucleic acid-binding protein